MNTGPQTRRSPRSMTPLSPVQAAAFQRLVWPLLPSVLRTARLLTHYEDAADDLAQDTMVKAMRAIDTYREGTNVKAWLMTILRRTHIDRLRSEHRHGRPLSLDAVAVDPPDTSCADAGQGRHDAQWREPEQLMRQFEDHAIAQALRELSEEMRWTLLLVDVEQMDHADAAAILNVPVGTIKSRAHRGRAMLRDRLYELACHRGWVKPGQRSEP